MVKPFAIIPLGCVLCVVVSGCGIQGPLETPQSAEKVTSTEKAKTKSEKDNPKPESEFLLDRLLR